MQCPGCGFENLPGVDYCEECLSPLYHLDLVAEPKTDSKFESSILKEKLYQIFSPPAEEVTPDTTLKKVLKLMVDKNVSSVVICDKNNLCGIFTERSFIRRACAELPINFDQPINQVMAKDPITLKGTNKIVDALHLMSVVDYSYAIIMDEPLRVLSIQDILHYIVELYPSLGGFDKLINELKQIALQDGVITSDEQQILDQVEREKESFMRIFTRIGSTQFAGNRDERLISNHIDEFLPSIERIAEKDDKITKDEKDLLQKIVEYLDKNRSRFFS